MNILWRDARYLGDRAALFIGSVDVDQSVWGELRDRVFGWRRQRCAGSMCGDVSSVRNRMFFMTLGVQEKAVDLAFALESAFDTPFIQGGKSALLDDEGDVTVCWTLKDPLEIDRSMRYDYEIKSSALDSYEVSQILLEASEVALRSSL